MEFKLCPIKATKTTASETTTTPSYLALRGNVATLPCHKQFRRCANICPQIRNKRQQYKKKKMKKKGKNIKTSKKKKKGRKERQNTTKFKTDLDLITCLTI